MNCTRARSPEVYWRSIGYRAFTKGRTVAMVSPNNDFCRKWIEIGWNLAREKAERKHQNSRVKDENIARR